MPTTNDMVLDRTEELIRRGREGDDRAREELWLLLQPYVRSIVNRQLRDRKDDMHDDLVNAGNKGLLDAYQKFDASKMIKFTTYAWKHVWKAIDIEKWVLRGLDEELAKYASTVVKAKHTIEESRKINPNVKEIAESCGVASDKVDRIVSFLDARFIHIEKESDDGSTYDWLSETDIWKEKQQEESAIKRVWEFQEEDIGFIIPKIATYLQGKWKKDDPERERRFVESIGGPDRCFRRRLVFANGSRGKLDVSALEEIHKYSSGAGVYDQRKAWKDHSSY